MNRLIWYLTGIAVLTASCADDSPQNGNNNTNANHNNAMACGNGVVDDGEECDDGAANSDFAADACRTNCTLAHCGDSVTDAGEDCDNGPANSHTVPDACRPDCTLPGCGDGVVDVSSGETCDPGPDAPDDHCSSQCQVMYCSNGVIEGDEVCDDGNLVGGDGCSPDCLSLEICGNGIIDTIAGETCEDGNTVAGDGCSPTCHLEFCGNGVLDASEICDDGNAIAGDNCSPDCLSLEVCGNQYVDIIKGEQCDDGNSIAGDGCGPTCLVETCGNEYLDPGEVCDDGNLFSGDGCSGDCLSEEICGNGYADYGAGEQCDDGNHVDGDGCQGDCMAPICGDGILDPGEYCDDGNPNDLDGCSHLCVPETGYTCTLANPAVCSSICGDGVVAVGAAGEACDDGGTVAGDGCSSTCGVEPGWSCQDSPSTCAAVLCGDLIGAGAEACDGTDLRGKSCFDLHFSGGVLSCDGTCAFDVSGCTIACGNGLVEAGEDCDDGNTTAGDGCSDHCQVEDFYACWSEPSDCTCVTYVKTTASGSASGASWEDAVGKVQDGIDVAVTQAIAVGSCEVWVAQGTYNIFESSPYDAVQMAYDIPLYGGFTGTETDRAQRNWSANPTILDGRDPAGTQRVYHVIHAAVITVLDGFVVTEGYSPGSWGSDHRSGAGLLAGPGVESLTVRNCAFTNHHTSELAGAIHSYAATSYFENCLFAGNSSTGSHSSGGSGGGGAIALGGAATFIRTTFVDNTGMFGGAIRGGSIDLTIEDSLFLRNRADSPYVNEFGQGGAIFLWANGTDLLTITNSVFAENEAEYDGGAIWLRWAEIDVTNTTFYGNTAGMAGGVIFTSSAIPMVVRNSILWGNNGWPGPHLWGVAGHVSDVTYSDVQGGWPGIGNLDLDPLVIDVLNNDYRLQAASPCVDAADDTVAPALDMESYPRIDIVGAGTVGTSADMGAHEYQP